MSDNPKSRPAARGGSAGRKPAEAPDASVEDGVSEASAEAQIAALVEAEREAEAEEAAIAEAEEAADSEELVADEADDEVESDAETDIEDEDEVEGEPEAEDEPEVAVADADVEVVDVVESVEPTRRLAVLGSPIHHSKSPALHRAAYDALGLPWSYEPVDVAEDGLADFIDGLGYTGWIGAEYKPKAGTEAGLGWFREFAGKAAA